jgi:hypothetical protein
MADKKSTKKTGVNQDSAPTNDQDPDLATSGRDTELAKEDAKDEVSDLRQAQADRATGGGGEGLAHAMRGESSSVLNPAFYPEAPEEESADAKDA